MKCFICNHATNKEKVLSFNADTFQRCCLFIEIRKQNHFKYGDLILIPELQTSAGYHLKCYRNLVAVKKSVVDEFNKSSQKVNTNKDKFVNAELNTSSNSTGVVTDSAGSSKTLPLSKSDEYVDNIIHQLPEQNTSSNTLEPEIEQSDNLTDVCIFCSSQTKRIGSNRQNLSVCTTKKLLNNIKLYANGLDDFELLEKLNNRSVLFYHAICRLRYQKQYEKTLDILTEETNWHKVREIHKNAFEAISEYIEKEIINQEKVFYFSDIFKLYEALFIEIADNSDDIKFNKYKSSYLEEKILKSYGEKIIIEALSVNIKNKVIYKRNIDIYNLIHSSAVKNNSEKYRLRDTAYELRNSIKSLSGKKLPNKLTTDDIFSGECDIPEILYDFISALVEGPDIRRQKTHDDDVRIKSLCEDIIFIVSKGRIKPPKQLKLGLTIKSLTNSRKILTILNKLGHTIAYTTAEELETELTFTSHETNTLIPSNIQCCNNLSTNVAFDNYDRYVDTLNGKGTLHDTVGIIYQFKSSDSLESTVSNISVNDGEREISTEEIPKKRRKFDGIPRQVQPYYKKFIKKTSLISLNEIQKVSEECLPTLLNANLRDLIWTISLSHVPDTPMWVGFNCKTLIDNSEQQIVDYLPQINAAPDRSVTRETLVYAQKIAKECNQEHIILTYDLGIAKSAMEIQITESPEFDNIFINLGGFHIEMAFFKALGKYIDGCGLIDILAQAEILAEGSVTGFIEGKHFNRCKRIHVLLSRALQALHFKEFLNEHENILFDEKIIDELQFIQNNSTEMHEGLKLKPELENLLSQYEEFLKLTLAGEHGNTAKYYMQYAQFVNIYLKFERSIRTSDFLLYVYSLYNFANLFFIFNQSNYAKWIVKYHSNLLEMKENNPKLLQEFKRGAFGVKRTQRNLSRGPVDITLEQTINADAANSMTGITNFTNSISARQRWALSHSIRTKIISKVMEELQITRKDDVAHELQESRIQKDQKALSAIVESIKQHMNPFDPALDKNQLFNLATGRATKIEICDFLLNVNTVGEKQKIKFIEDCNADEKCFGQAIKRNKILNFASDCLKKKQKSGGKEIKIKMERDIFGKLLSIALKEKINMTKCLTYPLAPAPPSLCQYTGEMMKTDKSTLAQKLKSQIEFSEITGNYDVDLIDGFYLLHVLTVSMPQTFGKISELILTRICNTKSPEVHIIFDRYFNRSIKDTERHNREETDIPYTISGPSQKRPNDFSKVLKNKKFKEALIKFLSTDWEIETYSSIIGNKTVYMTVDEKCFSFTSEGRSVRKKEELDYECYHEEADTRIIFHVNKLKKQSKILVKANDTDILVIILGNIYKFKDREYEIWLSNFSPKNKEINIVNCSKLANHLGENLCKALPGFHAFTGSDYTAAFFRKGKKKPFDILNKNTQYQLVFASLNNLLVIHDQEKVEIIQQYTNELYGVKKCKFVNLARLELFYKFYNNKNNNQKEIFKNVRNFDSSLIPPCWRSLEQKILRTVFVNSMWQNATDPQCIRLDPLECGWQLNDADNAYELKWFEGDAMPLTIEQILQHDKDETIPDDEDLSFNNRGNYSEDEIDD